MSGADDHYVILFGEIHCLHSNVGAHVLVRAAFRPAIWRVLQKMRRMIDFIREFKFGRPQQIAALLLLAFLTLCILVPFNVSDPDLWVYSQHGNYKIWLPALRCVLEPDKKMVEPCYS